MDPANPHADLAAGLDALAAGWLADAHVQFRVATTDAERNAYYRLRFEVVVEQRWAEPESMPDGLERDADDARAIHVLGWDGETLAAGARLILPAPGLPLPTEAAFQLTVEPAGEVVNLDRMLVAPAYRRDRTLFKALLGGCWIETRRHNFSMWAGIQSAILIRHYRRLGFDVRVLSPSRPHWGEPRYPIRFEPTQALILQRGESGAWRDRFIREQEARTEARLARKQGTEH